MILRLDDTDVERNTDASVQSIFEGLRWLALDWDEEYRQSDRLALHRQQAEAIFAKGLAYRDFTPAHATDDENSSAQGAWLFNPGMREMSREESDRRAARASRLRCAIACRAGKAAFCTSLMPSMVHNAGPPMKSKTLLCCAQTACRRTTLLPASTMPICASATLFAARII